MTLRRFRPPRSHLIVELFLHNDLWLFRVVDHLCFSGKGGYWGGVEWRTWWKQMEFHLELMGLMLWEMRTFLCY